jgi:hypothetical protein
MADTLQEYLVKIKYQQEGQQETIDGTKKVEDSVLKTTMAIIAAIASAAVAGTKLASNFEQLYFIAKRTGTTVDNLRAMQTAFTGLGSSASGANSALENIAAFMRNMPSSSEFMSGLGIETKDKNGKALDEATITKNIAARLRKYDADGEGPMAHQVAQLFGIGQNEEMAMRDKSFDEEFDKSRATLKNAHEQETAESAHGAMNIERQEVLRIESGASQALKPIFDGFTGLDKATNGLSTDIIAGTVALTGLAVSAGVVTKIFRLMAGASPAAAEAAGAEAIAEGAAGAAGAGLLAAVAPIAVGIGSLLYSPSAGEGSDLSKMGKEVTTPDILNGIAWAESRNNPNALNQKSGAAGEYGLMPNTSKQYGIDPYNAPAARNVARTIYLDLVEHYKGNINNALMAYNWGEGNMDMFLKTGHGLMKRDGSGYREMPKETKDYPGQVIKGMNVTININGAQNPNAVGNSVGKHLAAINQGMTAGAMR